MARIKPDPVQEAESVLGAPGEGEFTFLLVPVEAYSMVSQLAREQGCSVGEVFQKALMQYIRSAVGGEAVDEQPPRPEPDIVVRKRSR